jgi:undecaprenyl-phosphate galactose phosphotransferase
MKKSLIQRASLILSDIISLALSLFLARLVLNVIRPGDTYLSFDTFGVAKLGGLLVIVVFWYQEQYVKRRPSWEEVRLLYQTIFIFALLHLGISYLVSHHVIKLLNVLFWLILLVVLPLLRYLTKLILAKLGLWQRAVYIIGTGNNAMLTYQLFCENKILGYKIASFVTFAANPISDLQLAKAVPVIDYATLLNSNIEDLEAEVVFALPSNELLIHSDQINILQSKFTFVSIVPDISGLPLYGVELDHFFGSDQLFLRLQNNLGRRFNRTIKRLTDLILASLGLILLSPLFILIAGLILLTTKSKVFFKHKRVGLNGKHFYCIKFQTMYANSQEILANLLTVDAQAKSEWEKDFKLKQDPRVTPVGKFLRKTSLDELPQLFNVLKGEMSLVGPRPIVNDEVKRYQNDFYYYKLVRPGITGLWQISGRNDIDYTNRVRLDVWYVKNWSLWYDFVILFKTILVVLKREGAY